MKFLVFVMLAVGLTTSTIAVAMGKDEFIETMAKMKACVDDKYIDEAAINDALKPRVRHYLDTHFNRQEEKDAAAKSSVLAKNTFTTMGWGCEAAFNKLMALPLPPEQSPAQ